MKDSQRRVAFWSGAITLFALAVLAGLFLLARPQLDAMMEPPPNRAHLDAFQAQLDADGIPIKADILVALEIDRPTYVGEGEIPKSWDELIKAVDGVPVPGEPSSILVKTKRNDYAKFMNSGENRVRIVAGHSLDEKEVHRVLRNEFRTGHGKHPIFNIYAPVRENPDDKL